MTRALETREPQVPGWNCRPLSHWLWRWYRLASRHGRRRRAARTGLEVAGDALEMVIQLGVDILSNWP